MVFETLGPERIVLVSDAMAAAGLGDGDYVLGPLPVRVTHGTARIVTADGLPGSIAGSTSTLADCVRWAVEVAGVPADDVTQAAHVTPRAVLSGRGDG
jgi:N-acetylglucosamine-6-phosphate deacetylase